MDGSTPTSRSRVSVARALIDLLNGDCSVHFLLQRRGRTINRIAPHTTQVGMCGCLLRQREPGNQDRACEDAKELFRHLVTSAMPYFGSAPLISSSDVPSGNLIFCM